MEILVEIRIQPDNFQYVVNVGYFLRYFALAVFLMSLFICSFIRQLLGRCKHSVIQWLGPVVTLY